MATLQDLLASKEPSTKLEDLLQRFKASTQEQPSLFDPSNVDAKYANTEDLKGSFGKQEPMEGQFSPLDKIADKAPVPPAEEKGFTLPPKDVYKLRDESAGEPAVKPDAQQVRNSNAAAKNPVMDHPNNAGFKMVGESRNPDAGLPAVRDEPGMPSKNPVQENIEQQTGSPNLPKASPEVIGKGTSKAPDLKAGPIDEAELVSKPALIEKPGMPVAQNEAASPTMAHGGMVASSGLDMGMHAFQDAQNDPNSAVSKINALINSNQQIAHPAPDSIPPPTTPTDNVPPPTGTIPQALAKMPAPLMGTTPQNGGASGSWEENTPAPASVPDAPSASPAAPEAPNKYKALMDMYKSTQGTGLKDAQDQANKNTFIDNLMKGVNQLNSGITGSKITGPAKVDNSALDSLLKSAQDPVTQYNEQTKNAPNDPSSKYSQIMKNFLAPKLKAAGIDVDSEDYKNMSGADLQSVAKMVETDSNAKLKQDYLMTVKKAANDQKQALADQKTEDRFDKNFTTFSNNLAKPELAGRMGPVAKNIGIRDSADRINALIDGAGGDYNKLTNSQVFEIAKSMDSMLSNGATTMSGTKEFQPDTWKGKFAHFAEQATANPQGAGEGGFVKLYKDTIDREKKLANQKVQNFYEDARQGISDNDYEARKDQYDRVIKSKIARVQQEQAQNPIASKTADKAQLAEYARVNFKGDQKAAADYLKSKGIELQ